MLINTVCAVVNYELEMFCKILTKSFQLVCKFFFMNHEWTHFHFHFQLICKFFYMNHEWTIEEYDRRRDPAKQVEDNFSFALLNTSNIFLSSSLGAEQ